MIKEGDPVTVNYPEGSRDGTVITWHNTLGATEGDTFRRKYVILFEDDESADPAVHESLVEPRGQETLL